MKHFDPYEFRARVVPALIVVSPFILPGVAVFQRIGPNLLECSAAGFVFLVSIYALSSVIRQYGENNENALWDLGNGPASARIMRPNDPIFSSYIKTLIASAVERQFAIKIYEQDSPAGLLDQRIEDAFQLARQKVLQLNPKGLWRAHEAEYEFLRNLWASCWILGICAVISFLICVITWLLHRDVLTGILAFFALLFCVAVMPGYFCLLRNLLRSAADSYAESVWMSFLYQEGATNSP